MAAAEVQLKHAQDAVEEAIGAARNSAATPIPPEELERRKRLLKRSEEELARRTAELAAQRIELGRRSGLLTQLLQKEREARLEWLQSEARAATSAIGTRRIS